MDSMVIHKIGVSMIRSLILKRNPVRNIVKSCFSCIPLLQVLPYSHYSFLLAVIVISDSVSGNIWYIRISVSGIFFVKGRPRSSPWGAPPPPQLQSSSRVPGSPLKIHRSFHSRCLFLPISPRRQQARSTTDESKAFPFDLFLAACFYTNIMT